MKFSFLRNLAFIFFMSLVLAGSSQQKLVIGMTMEEVSKIYPGLKIIKEEKYTTMEKPDTLYGLSGSWGFRFENNKLDWIFFHKYMDEINEKNFNKCKNAIDRIIEDFTKAYGKPDSSIIGNSKFIDPLKKHHWGYDVKEARWKNFRGMKIKAEFSFLGGKGDYHFYFSIHYFGKDYPYYD